MFNNNIKVKILDFDSEDIYPAKIIINDGIIADIIPLDETDNLDFKGVLVPGFIDAHMHIESTMLTPSNFARAVLPFGTTSVIADAHEIANVMGLDGIYFMIDDGSKVPFDFYFSAPSCVPATSFETNGATIDSKSIEKLFEIPQIICLGEMMNFPGVINGNKEVISKLELANKLNIPIDGHAPLVTGKDLEKYASYGISTDHECTNFNEAIEKKNLGIKIMVREGSSARNIDGLLNIKDRINYWTKMSKFGNIEVEDYEKLLRHPIFDFLATDDKNPKELQEGHLNLLIKKVIRKDIDPIEAIKMVTVNPAKHYNLNIGEIKKGKKANFVLIDNLNDFNILKTFIGGQLVAENGKTLFNGQKAHLKNTFNVEKKKIEDFDIKTDKDNVEVNIIKITDGSLLTDQISDNLKVKNNVIQPDIEKDILKISVIERYGGNNMSNAFIKGFNLKKGAIATSVSHDSHNIITIGTNSEDMANAVNNIIDNRGGVTIANKNKIISLKLPIAGLMSDKDVNTVADEFKKLEDFAKSLGSTIKEPFMTLSFMALLVIPSLKISDKGLFNLDKLEFEKVIFD